FRLLSFEEELELIQGLNKSSGREAGIYPEMKAPAFHAAEGKDIVAATMNVLKKYGYTKNEDKCYVQCFDPDALIRMRQELNCKLKMVQLIGENAWSEAKTDYDAMKTTEGLRAIAEYADGIGPWIPQVIDPQSGEPTGLIGLAKEQGLQVHPYTMRADDLPNWAGNFNELAEKLLYKAGADGAFSDFPDLLVNAIRNR
ncbi:MAG: glycerophosphodiester phosphodiesterase family protein, partial [Calditrichota bacterium]